MWAASAALFLKDPAGCSGLGLSALRSDYGLDSCVSLCLYYNRSQTCRSQDLGLGWSESESDLSESGLRARLWSLPGPGPCCGRAGGEKLATDPDACTDSAELYGAPIAEEGELWYNPDRNVGDCAAGFDYMKISIDIYILADALILITFEWIAILGVCRMIATHN